MSSAPGSTLGDTSAALTGRGTDETPGGVTSGYNKQTTVVAGKRISVKKSKRTSVSHRLRTHCVRMHTRIYRVINSCCRCRGYVKYK
jgi:hypothetical protein